jgi:hypothetical protein
MAGFNTLIWNPKDSLSRQHPQIENADEQHKRDLSGADEADGGQGRPATCDVRRITLEQVHPPSKPAIT